MATIEIGILIDDKTDRTVQTAVYPSDFVHHQDTFKLRNPVDLEPLVRGDGRYGEPWPDNYSVGVRLLDSNGDYILPEQKITYPSAPSDRP